MKKLVVLILSLVAFEAKAIVGSPIKIVAFGAASYGSVALNGDTLTNLSYLGNAYVGYKMANLSFGVAGGYRYTAQLSDVKLSSGNFRGNRIDLGPGVGVDLGNIFIGAEYDIINWHTLAEKAADGNTLTYSSILGGKVYTTIGLMPYIGLTIFAEYASYGSEKLGEVTTTLSTPVTWWSLGAGLSFVL